MTKRNRKKIPSHELKKLAGKPLYKGTLSDGGKYINIWCPVCHDMHQHHNTTDAFEVTHRSAHCAMSRMDQPSPHELPNYVDSYYVFHDGTIEEQVSDIDAIIGRPISAMG